MLSFVPFCGFFYYFVFSLFLRWFMALFLDLNQTKRTCSPHLYRIKANEKCEQKIAEAKIIKMNEIERGERNKRKCWLGWRTDRYSSTPTWHRFSSTVAYLVLNILCVRVYSHNHASTHKKASFFSLLARIQPKAFSVFSFFFYSLLPTRSFKENESLHECFLHIFIFICLRNKFKQTVTCIRDRA